MSSKRNDPRLSRKYKEVRLRALARDGYVCHYCGAENKDMTIDHIIPISSGNTEEEVIKLCHYNNLQPLWAEENLLKSNKSI